MGLGERTALVVQHAHRRGGDLVIGDTQVRGGLSGGMGLLGVAAGGVPLGDGEGDQDQGGEEHGGSSAVLAPAERTAGLDDSTGGRAERPGVGAFGADVAAGCPLEGSGGSSRLGAGGGRESLGDRVQEFSNANDLSGSIVVAVVEEAGGMLGDAGGAASLAGGGQFARPSTAGGAVCSAVPSASSRTRATRLGSGTSNSPAALRSSA